MSNQIIHTFEMESNVRRQSTKKEGGENVYDDKEREKYAIKSELSRRLNVFANNDLTFIIAIQLNAKIKQKKRNERTLTDRERIKKKSRARRNNKSSEERFQHAFL